MRVVHLFTGPDGQSHFQELEVPENLTERGSTKTPQLPATGVIFRRAPNTELDYHRTYRRQFVVGISGRLEIECGDGTIAVFGPGDVLLADDTTGQGHKSRELDGPRQSIQIALPDDLDVDQWRVPAPPH